MTTKFTGLIISLSLCAVAQVKLDMTPRSFSGIPGEVCRIDLAIESESAEKAVLRVPHSSNLVLRAVEKYPVVKNQAGMFVHRRCLVLQGVEAGKTVMTNLLVEINGVASTFPSLTIEVRDVKNAEPPEKSVVQASCLP
jgi:hypothetical protein